MSWTPYVFRIYEADPDSSEGTVAVVLEQVVTITARDDALYLHGHGGLVAHALMFDQAVLDAYAAARAVRRAEQLAGDRATHEARPEQYRGEQGEKLLEMHLDRISHQSHILWQARLQSHMAQERNTWANVNALAQDMAQRQAVTQALSKGLAGGMQ